MCAAWRKRFLRQRLPETLTLELTDPDAPLSVLPRVVLAVAAFEPHAFDTIVMLIAPTLESARAPDRLADAAALLDPHAVHKVLQHTRFCST